MGYGYDMACSKCGRHHAVMLGCGFSLPTVYSELVSDIETGAFGKEWQELAAQTECFAIDVETHLFRCETCGFWECAPSLSIYTPKDVEKTLETQYGEKTVREWGRIPYVTAKELESDYVLVGEFTHVCEHCGHDMRMFSNRRTHRATLMCPDCGGKLERCEGVLLWD